MWLRHARSRRQRSGATWLRHACSRHQRSGAMWLRQARSRRRTLATAHELGEERDPVSRPERGLEVVLDAEYRIVDEHFDVLAELLTVPEGLMELRESRRDTRQHASDRRAGHQRFLQDAPARPV